MRLFSSEMSAGSSTFLNNQRKACLQRFAMAILYRIIASKSFLNWRLNRIEACLRGFALAIIVIALLHLHLVSTRIWIERGAGLHGFVVMAFIL